MQRRCTICHSLAPIYRSVGTDADWNALVRRMVYHHQGKLIAHISDDEARAIAAWLARERPPKQASVRIGSVPTGWVP